MANLFSFPHINLRNSFKVWRRNLAVYRKLYIYSILPNFFEPLIYLSAMGLGLGYYVSGIPGMSYLQFIAPGLIASTAMFAVSFECTFASYVRMTFQKTYEAIIATPVNVEDVILGEILWGATKSLLYGSIILLVIAPLGLVKSWTVLLVPLVLILFGILFSLIAMIFTSLVPNIDSFNYYFSLGVTPMFMFSGIFFPLDHMPFWVRAIAEATPLYHMVNLCRELVTGAFTSHFVWGLVYVVVGSVILFVLPINLMKRRLIK